MSTKRVSLRGRGQDIFFGDYTADPAADPAAAVPADPRPAAPDTPPPPSGTVSAEQPAAPEPDEDTVVQLQASAPDSTPARKLASKLARQQPDHTADTPDIDGDLIEPIRKTVKGPGKEVSFVRLTPEEKARVADIVYAYKRQGKKISETDIARIGLNYILENYDRRGTASMLARVIDALLA